MCEFHVSNGNGLGDIWWTYKFIYFSIIDCKSLLKQAFQIFCFQSKIRYSLLIHSCIDKISKWLIKSCFFILILFSTPTAHDAGIICLLLVKDNENNMWYVYMFWLATDVSKGLCKVKKIRKKLR